MGFYAKYILPRIIDLAMKNKEASSLRAEWIPLASGKVLEVGIGSGLNLPFYSSRVQRIYGVDPSMELQQMARKRAMSSPTGVEFLLQKAEEPLPLESGSIDTAVVTWTLCSIGEPGKALQEMNRVLSTRGRLIFIEHGRAPDPGVRAWQERLTPLWSRFAGGCHLNRDTEALLTGAGFQIDVLNKSYLPGPRPMSYTCRGVAVKAPLR